MLKEKKEVQMNRVWIQEDVWEVWEEWWSGWWNQRLRERESEADRALTANAVPCWGQLPPVWNAHQPVLTWAKLNSWRGWGGETSWIGSPPSAVDGGIPLYLPHTTPPLHPLPPSMHPSLHWKVPADHCLSNKTINQLTIINKWTQMLHLNTQSLALWSFFNMSSIIEWN